MKNTQTEQMKNSRPDHLTAVSSNIVLRHLQLQACCVAIPNNRLGQSNGLPRFNPPKSNTFKLHFLKNIAAVLVFLFGGYTLSLDATAVTAAEVLVGRFTVNARDNAAGRYTDQSRPDYTQANPFFGNLIPPGPVFINATPGQYKLVVEAGAGCGVWSGDASRGTFLVTGHNPSEIVTFTQAFGQIVLYYWDWYPYDNDPNVRTTIAVYRIEAGNL
jgi:hypothetical protein